MSKPLSNMGMVVFLVCLTLVPGVWALDKKDIKIKVLSGNNDLESAKKTARALKDRGYRVSRVDQASRSDFTSSTIYHAKTFKGAAETLASKLNILLKNVRPLTWHSEFDIILVTAGTLFSKPVLEKSLDPIEPSPKPRQADIKPLNQKQENISFALAEAHSLFVNNQYQLALEKYRSLELIISKSRQICKPLRQENKQIKNKDLSVQILSKDSDLDLAQSIARRLADKGYRVTEPEHTLRSDLAENTLYYKPSLKKNAENLLQAFNGSLILAPLKWSSKYNMILVAPKSISDNIQILDINEQFAQLRLKEHQIKTNMDMLIHEAFYLFASGSDCSLVQNKFELIKAYINRVEEVCQTAKRLDSHAAEMNNQTFKKPRKKSTPPKTVMVLNLDEAISIAVNNNTEIEEAEEKIKAALQGKKSSRADFFPRAALNYSYTRLNEAPVISIPDEYSMFMSGDIPMGSEDIYTWNVTLSQPLFTGFGLISQYESQKIRLKASKIQKKAALLNLVRNVKKAYYDLLLSQKMEQVTRETVKNLKSHKDDAEHFYSQGIYPYNDLLKAQVALANAVQENEKAKSLTSIAKASLNILLDLDVNQTIQVQEFSPASPIHFQMTDLLHEAAENRPDLKLITLAVKSADLSIRAAKSVYYPQVSLVGQYEQTGQDILATENDFGETNSASLTLRANWSLFKGGKTKYDIAQLEHDKKALFKQYKTAENNIGLEIKSIYENLLVSEKNITTSQKSVAQAKENWRITNFQYLEQTATSTDVLDARTFLSQAQLNYLRAHYGYMKYLADLERAVGKQLVSLNKSEDAPSILNKLR